MIKLNPHIQYMNFGYALFITGKYTPTKGFENYFSMDGTTNQVCSYMYPDSDTTKFSAMRLYLTCALNSYREICR